MFLLAKHIAEEYFPNALQIYAFVTFHGGNMPHIHSYTHTFMKNKHQKTGGYRIRERLSSCCIRQV